MIFHMFYLLTYYLLIVIHITSNYCTQKVISCVGGKQLLISMIRLMSYFICTSYYNVLLPFALTIVSY